MKQELIKALSSYQEYNQTAIFIQSVQADNQQYMQICSETIKEILQDEQSPPLTKFMALKFVNDLVQTWTFNWLKDVENNLLPCYEQIAKYKLDSKDEDRGKTYFIEHLSHKKYEKNVELQQIGNSYFRYALESIWVWSKWFPLDSENGKLSLFKICQERLAIIGVTFPKLYYFPLPMVINYLSVQRPPREMLSELREYVKIHMQNDSRVTLKITQQVLEKTFTSPKNTSCINIQTYADVLKRWVEKMKAGNMGLEVELKLKGSRMQKIEKLLQATLKSNSQSKMILSQHAANFTQILNEKEKLFMEINKHINDKEHLQQAIQKANQEILQQKQNIEELNYTIEQLQEIQNPVKMQQIEQQQVAPMNEKDIQKTAVHKKDQIIQRQDKQLEYLQTIVKQQNESIEEYQNFRIKMESDFYDQQSKCAQQAIVIEDQKTKINQQQQQILKLNEQLSQYKEMLTRVRNEHVGQLQSQSKYMQKLEIQNTCTMQENQQLGEELEMHKQKLEIMEQELSTHKMNLAKIVQIKQLDPQSKTQQKFNKNEQGKFGQSGLTFPHS